jgi:hypothetical protein
VVPAPGEGEAMCAALTCAGVADMVWTHDVVDALLFGATAVVRGIENGQNTFALLNFAKPSESKFYHLTRENVKKMFDLEV